jgi:two-component system OmpR family response regulator
MPPSVLIVEDDPGIREVYQLKLEIEGLLVRGAENGKEALQLLRGFSPDVILLDMLMPLMGGMEFLERFKSLGLRADVFVFSNMASPDQVKAALGLGAIDYWTKSDCTPEIVTSRIMDHWRARRKGTS